MDFDHFDTTDSLLLTKSLEALSPTEAFNLLLEKLKYMNLQSLAKIQKAFEFALEKHGQQKRKSGEPYIIHPIAVSVILSDLKVDDASIISALLHDVVEDTNTSLQEIESEFGKNIAELVDGLTKIRKIKFSSKEERLAENFRKMVLAMAKDLRVILVKLADRLHNMRTLQSLAPPKRERIAQETLDIYAPLANRLGIYGIKSELEDLCLKETKNEIYKELSKNVAAKKKQREDYISEVIDILQTKLKDYGFENVKVFGRPKHFYSIYKKMVDRRLAFQDIHDLFAFRIIVDTIKDCYEVLGIVHSMWKPMPGRFKDYIAMPKANLYQSLHTTVVRPNGPPAEIQIRTQEMHNVCEYGVAAHWAYKETGEQLKGDDLKKFSWLRQIMELHQDLEDPGEFLAAVKVDLFDEEIFVFTPKGDVVQLPSKSTPLDFAFSVHSDIGLRTVGAKVNGRICPLRTALDSGDIVEIITSSNQKPTKDWLNFVTTSKARNKIRSFLRSEKREESKKIGKEIFSNELEKRGFDFEKYSASGKLEAFVKSARESNFDDLLVAIGYGKLNAKDLILKVLPKEIKDPTKELIAKTLEQKENKKQNTSGVLVSGLNNILVTFSKCCNPLPGEKIVGFITRGRGVSIHHYDCLRAFDLDPERKVEVSWLEEDQGKTFHNAYIRIITQERQGVLADVTMAISNCGANIKHAQVNISSNMMGVLDFELALKDLDQLNRVVRSLEIIKDVVFVERRTMDKVKKESLKKS